MPADTASAAPARATYTAGRVVRLGAAGDSLPVAGARVVLHRVGQDRQGIVDSFVTPATGVFRIAFPADTGAIFLLSARYAGLEYFSQPIATDPARPDTAIIIAVADTSAVQPVTVATRQIVITRPEPDGTRSVLDLIRLENAGPATRVGRDSLAPSWAMPLPADIFEFHIGPSGTGMESVQRQGDALVLLSPIAPGPTDLLVQYAIPARSGRFTVPLSDGVERLEILLEEEGARVISGGLQLEESRAVEGRTFHLWAGAAPAGVVAVALPPTDRAVRWALIGLVAAVAVGLGAAWLLIRRRAGVGPPPRPAPADAADPAALADAAAELDRRFAGREQETPPDDWQAYVAERARLKSAIAAALAARDRRT